MNATTVKAVVFLSGPPPEDSHANATAGTGPVGDVKSPADNRTILFVLDPTPPDRLVNSPVVLNAVDTPAANKLENRIYIPSKPY